VQASLAQTGHWLRQLGRVPQGFAVRAPALELFLETTASAYGALCAVRHGAQLGRTPATWTRSSERPGDSPARW
jgi:hypothetical protein